MQTLEVISTIIVLLVTACIILHALVVGVMLAINAWPIGVWPKRIRPITLQDIVTDEMLRDNGTAPMQ